MKKKEPEMTMLPGRSLKEEMDALIRVDHAGEVAATRIYEGMLRTLPKDSSKRAEIEEMLQTEESHLSFFQAQIQEQKTRPSLLLPLWDALSFGLGALSGRLGPSWCDLCTQAVEEVIEEHYAQQVEWLSATPKADVPATYGDVAPQNLSSCLARIRQEEGEHKNAHAPAAAAPLRHLFRKVVEKGCKTAIFFAKNT